MTKSVIYLCGAGGTGKSSVSRVFADYSNFVVMPSTSRATYKRLGINSETDSLRMDTAQQLHLQECIMDDHLACVTDTFAKTPDGSTMVVDRSPLDHLAYWIRSNSKNPEAKLQDFFDMRDRVIKTMEELKADSQLLVIFEFPVPWPTDDSFRDQNPITTLEMSYLSTAVVLSNHTRLHGKSAYLNMKADKRTPRERAQMIADTLSELNTATE